MKKYVLVLIFTCFVCQVHAEEKAWSEFSAILKPSTVQGVGVFATHDIKAGTQIFTQRIKEWKNKRTPIQSIPEKFQQYCIKIDNTKCHRPGRFDRMEVWFYLKHSIQGNVIEDDKGLLFAKRNIKTGEEFLLVCPEK